MARWSGRARAGEEVVGGSLMTAHHDRSNIRDPDSSTERSCTLNRIDDPYDFYPRLLLYEGFHDIESTKSPTTFIPLTTLSLKSSKATSFVCCCVCVIFCAIYLALTMANGAEYTDTLIPPGPTFEELMPFILWDLGWA